MQQVYSVAKKAFMVEAITASKQCGKMCRCKIFMLFSLEKYAGTQKKYLM